jgi:hypothetical protein
MGVGGAAAGTHVKSTITGTTTGSTTQIGCYVNTTFDNSATSQASGIRSTLSTVDASFIASQLAHFRAGAITKGAASTITNLYGLYIEDQTQGPNNFGITSLVSSGTDKWNIYASGTAANYFAGNVGIGTSSPLALLNTYQVNGGGDANILFQNFSTTTSTAVALYLSPTNGSLTTGSIRSAFIKGINVGGGVTALTFGTNSSGADPTEKMRLDSSGNLGIGTSSPLVPLDIRATQGTLNLSAGSDPLVNLNVLNPDTTAGTGPTIAFSSYYSGFSAGPLATIAVERVLGSGATASALSNNIIIRQAQTSSTTLTERLRIDSVGNVGIGTTTPQNKLHVSGTALVSAAVSTDAALRLSNTLTTTILSAGNWSDGSAYLQSARTSDNTAQTLLVNPAGGNVVFNENGVDADFRVESDTNTHALFVDAGNSRVGINNASPTEALDVTGNIKASGTITEAGVAVVVQTDIGTAANEIPLNQYLGALAYVDTETPALNIGTGITTGTGTICKANGGLMGGIYNMTILIDLTGLNSGGTAGDIIGVNGTALPCYIAQLPAMTVLGGRMTCLETPAGGDTDIDLYSATEGTGVEDQAITALTETQIINAGTQSVGTVTYFAADPAANVYFYLVGQGTANATYTAGRFLIEVFGVQ